MPVGQISGRVVGEHGAGLVVCASSTTVAGRPITAPVGAVTADIHGRSPAICAGIGRTRSGPTGAVLAALRLALGLADGATELSAPYRGGVWLGLPVVFSAGTARVLAPVLNHDERARLATTAAKLARLYARVRAAIPASRT